jgi:hypothetical protein
MKRKIAFYWLSVFLCFSISSVAQDKMLTQAFAHPVDLNPPSLVMWMEDIVFPLLIGTSGRASLKVHSSRWVYMETLKIESWTNEG